MEDFDSFQFEESDFEIVDECLDDENDSYPSDTSVNMESEKILLNVRSENSEEKIGETDSPKEIPVVKIEEGDKQESSGSLEKSQTDTAIDFTADITLDQLDDNDVMEHLTEIESIALDSESFDLKSDKNDVNRSLSQQNTEQSNKPITESQDIILIDESIDKNNKCEKSSEDQWYNEQIDSKVKTVVERLLKLARVLKHSYPCYAKCLDRIEAKIGTPICKLDPPRRYPSDQTHINRWKFICTRKPTEESADSKMEADNKNVKTVWQLEPCETSNTIANNVLPIIPTFVMRAVKVFENFINTVDQVQLNVKVKEEAKDDDVIVLENDEKSSEDADTTGNKSNFDTQPNWLWLLVRSNSKNELMMFATGKCITHNTMEKLKQLFEGGTGANCNVKSLYCKSMTKLNNVQTSNTTFLVGTEALDETVGELKIQLAPKTNFWLSTAGAAELAKTVESFLDPPDLSTVIDIGCGLGLMGLTVARKCYQVIGIDSPTEVEEAEMTCELNKIKNAYFLMGEPSQMMNTIEKSVEWRRVFAIINANTNIGRTIEVMTGLRKIKNLRRVVMVTTLTKQSVRSILELTRPADDIIGDPFIATRAAIVDTLPTGPQFEVVILMERRPMPQVLNAVLSQASPDLVIQNAPNKTGKNSPKKNNNVQKPAVKKSNFVKNTMALANKKNGASTKKVSSPGGKYGLGNNKGQHNDKPNEIPTKKFVKNPYYDKPFSAKNNKKHSNQKKSPAPLKSQGSPNQHKLQAVGIPQANSNQYKSPGVSKPQVNSRSPRKNAANSSFRMRKEVNNTPFGLPHDSQKRKYDWDGNCGSARDVFIPDKRSRESDDNLRTRMSDNYRNESDLLQKVKEQQRLLEVAKQKLSGSSQAVDNFTAQEVQDMLNLAIERTNQIQNQIPRSVWDRIAPPEHQLPDVIQDEMLFKGRRVQEMNHEDIVITTSNQGYTQTFDASWVYKRRSNIPPLEPNLILPLDTYIPLKSDIKDYKPQNQDDSKRNETPWVPPSCSRRALTPLKHPLLTTPKKLSPTRGPFLQQSTPHIHDVGVRRQMPSTSKQFTPMQRSLSPPPRLTTVAPPQELMRRQSSPPRRQAVRVGFGDEWDIPSRGASEKQTNWQSAIDNRQQNNPNWGGKNFSNENWTNNSSGGGGSGGGGGGGGGDAWNKQMAVKQPVNNQWQQQQHQVQQQQQHKQQHKQQMPSDNRFGGPSGGDWNIRGKELMNSTNNTRNEPWKNTNKQRWSEPQQNTNDWNDLPEDARDPWGDDGCSNGPQQGNWNRNTGPNEWLMPRNNWQNPGPSMMNSTKPQWQTNMTNSNPNMNNTRWSGGTVGNNNNNNNNMKPSLPNTNWQQGNSNNNNNNNNGWRQQSSFGGFQQRPFN